MGLVDAEGTDEDYSPSKVWHFQSLDDASPLPSQCCCEAHTAFTIFAHGGAWLDAKDLPDALRWLGISAATLSSKELPSALSLRGFCRVLQQLQPQVFLPWNHLQALQATNLDVDTSSIRACNSMPTRASSPRSPLVPYETRQFVRSRSAPRKRSAAASRRHTSTDTCRPSRQSERTAELLRRLHQSGSQDNDREATRRQATRWRGEFAPPPIQQKPRTAECTDPTVEGQPRCSPLLFQPQSKRTSAAGSTLHNVHSAAPRVLVSCSPHHRPAASNCRESKTVQIGRHRPQGNQSLRQRIAELEAQVRLLTSVTGHSGGRPECISSK